ncbi:MAG: D-alanyl-D-alanine carboxypeptidase/D-alanyl-D-alanine-endopeptidase [Phycisphaerales bacterium]|nr:D-alanyl-D-alanine carboxypeptidase/D-alanyl-D-alanine-endopeptidase [Phycisphaerales bacterium]
MFRTGIATGLALASALLFTSTTAWSQSKRPRGEVVPSAPAPTRPDASPRVVETETVPQAGVRPGSVERSEIAAIRAHLERRLARVDRNSGVGILVTSVDDGRVWFAHNADAPLKPASVLKLFTSAAALLRFGPDFEYETRIYVRPRLHGERGRSDVWVVGSGDPAIGDPRFAERAGQKGSDLLRAWADTLVRRGVAEVETLFLDDSVFDRQWRNRDWPADQALRWYQAPVGALCVNDNCIDASVLLEGRVPTIRVEPPLPSDWIVNELQRARQHSPRILHSGGAGGFVFSGPVARAHQFESTACADPTLFFGAALREALESRGISVRRVARGEYVESGQDRARLVLRHRTRLADAVWRCNTFSQNLFAECIAKTLSAYRPDGRRSTAAGSWDEGLRVARHTLEDAGVSLRGADFRDGCGLSHGNRVTARQTADLLRVMLRQERRVAETFVASLAVCGGEEGSMRTRFADELLRGRVVGKTGSISGVSTLAGYLTRDDGEQLAFAILMNDAGNDALAVEVCRVLAGDYPSAGDEPGVRRERKTPR